jgi:hypothetical protein
VALDFDALKSAGTADDLAVARMSSRQGWYDPFVLDVLKKTLAITQLHPVREVRVHDLLDGAIVADNVMSLDGSLLCIKGQEVTPSLRARLRNYVGNIGVPASIMVDLTTVPESTQLMPLS